MFKVRTKIYIIRIHLELYLKYTNKHIYLYISTKLRVISLFKIRKTIYFLPQT